MSRRYKHLKAKVRRSGSYEDTHHLLYQRKHFSQGYAHKLREHWYFKVEIPMNTCHRELHSTIHDIPCPNGSLCKKAYLKLIEYEEKGLISESDTPEERLQFLIDCWDGSCNATVAILRWQQDKFAKFRERKML